jgi:transposase
MVMTGPDGSCERQYSTSKVALCALQAGAGGGGRARRRSYPLNRRAYRQRNVVERMFGRMKDWRRIATRYDRLARNFLFAIALVATVCFWLT